MAERSLPGLILKAATSPDEPDAELLGRFVRDRDAAAFEGLVRRHGPMVWGVCRKLLGDGPDTEDAFQATFLVLVRKAASVSPRGMVGNWLYGVAWRTATHLRVRVAAAHARRRELADVPDARTPEPAIDETAAVVHAELASVPDRYRVAVVLCELEGRTIAEAAHLLGVAVGTVASRLARGRAMLAARLRRRGFAASVSATLTATPSVSARLNELAVAMAKATPHEVAPTVSELSREVMSAMLTHKLKVAGLAAVVVLLVAGVTGLAAWGIAARPEPPVKEPPVDDGNKYTDRLIPPGKRVGAMDGLWWNLERDEPHCTQAVLGMVGVPKQTVAFLKTNLRPVKATKDEIKKWIADLASEKDDVWKPAFDTLSYFDPRLVFKPDEAMAEATVPLARQRLASILIATPNASYFALKWTVQSIEITSMRGLYTLSVIDSGPNDAFDHQSLSVAGTTNFLRRGSWTRAVRAVLVLEHIGGPDALAILKDMATGHPDAQPTQVAKEAVARLTAPAP